MDFDNIYDSLSYDTKILNDMLVQPFNEPYPDEARPISPEERLKRKKLERVALRNSIMKELVDIKKAKEASIIATDKLVERSANQQTNKPVQEGFSHCSCGKCVRGGTIESLFDEKSLLFIIVMLVLMCFNQYQNQKVLLATLAQRGNAARPSAQEVAT